MADISVNSTSIDFVSTGVIQMLDSMMSQHLVKDKQIVKVIKGVEMQVKKAVQKALVASLSNGKLYTKTKSSTIHYRHVEKAVKMSIYKKILGANVSLYSTQCKGLRGGDMPIQGRYNPRRLRSQRTKEMQSYAGTWADMIIRWVNSGTAERKTGYRQHYYNGRNTGEHSLTRGLDRNGNHDWRKAVSWSTGRIPGNNFFSIANTKQQNAAEELADRINKILIEVSNEFNNK